MATTVAGGRTTVPGGRLRGLSRWSESRRPLLVGVAIVAFVVRLTPLLLGGGLEFYGRYDDGVYYAASDALTYGRLPYKDFVLLHPPGLLLVLAPFALLGRVTSDPVGMAAGRLAFMAIGALNAVLVAVLADRWSRRAAIAAGVIYACWLPAVYAEQSTMLEPLGGTALLVALLLLLKTARPPTARAQVLAGVALGLACSLKIWYVAPWLAVVVWQLAARRPRTAVRVIVGGAAALAVVVLPFFILAPRRMFNMVVRDQLLRSDARSSRTGRLSSILGVRTFVDGHPGELHVATAVLAVVFVVAAAYCTTRPESRVLVLVLLVNVVVLMASPAYFPHYAALTAAPAALVLGVAIGTFAVTSRLGTASRTAVLLLLVAAFLTSGAVVASTAEGNTFPNRQFAHAAPSGCVTADDPTALIQMNRLSDDLRSGCRVAIDVTGITYDTLHRVEPDGRRLPRERNLAFQRYLYDYLLSGKSFVVIRRRDDAIPPGFAHALDRQPVLARSHGLVLRRVTG
jgi:hypothetical protein